MQGLNDAIQNGGSTLANYGLSLQEVTRLITAANSSIQDPKRVGTGLKAIATNLAGLTTSAKDGSIHLNYWVAA